MVPDGLAEGGVVLEKLRHVASVFLATTCDELSAVYGPTLYCSYETDITFDLNAPAYVAANALNTRVAGVVLAASAKSDVSRLMLLDCIIAARCNELSAAVHLDSPASVFYIHNDKAAK